MFEAKTDSPKTQNSLEVWSTKNAVSKNSMEAGVPFPLSKATIGAKFGSGREKTHVEKSKFATGSNFFTPTHLTLKAQIGLDEVTGVFSSEVKDDNKRLRRERRFDDSVRSFEKCEELWRFLDMGLVVLC